MGIKDLAKPDNLIVSGTCTHGCFHSRHLIHSSFTSRFDKWKVTEAPHRSGFAQCSNQAEFRIHFYAQPSGIFPQTIYKLILMYLQEDLITVSQYLYGNLAFTKHLHTYCLVGAL